MVSFKEFLLMEADNDKIEELRKIIENAASDINDNIGEIDLDLDNDEDKEKTLELVKDYVILTNIRKLWKNNIGKLNQAAESKIEELTQDQNYEDAINNFSNLYDDKQVIKGFIKKALGVKKGTNAKLNTLINEFCNNFDDVDENNILDKLHQNLNDKPEEKDEEIEEKPKPKNDEETEKPEEKDEETEEKPKDGLVGADNISSAGMDLPVKELRDAIYSGKEGQVESVLNKWEAKVVKKIQEVIDARKRQTDKEGKYLEEEQVMLWEGIIQKFKDSKGLKYNREKNVEGMYDKNNEQHDANYKAKVHEIVNQAKNKLGEICRGINDYDISKRDRKKKIDRATFIIDRLIDSSYRVITDVRKNSSALGADQKAKIEAGKQRDADDEAFKNSFRGKDFEEKLDAKSKGYADAFKAIFNKAGQKAQTLEDIAEAEVVGAIRESKSVEDFLSAVYHKNVVSSENGSLGTMTIAQFLSKKGIVVPKEEEVKNNNRKDLRLSEKKPEILGFTAGYEGIKQYIDNYKYYRSGIISTIIKELKQVLNMPGDVNIKKQKLEEVKATYGKVQNGEIINILISNITALKELDSQQSQTNANDQNVDSQNNKLTPEQEEQAKEIEEMSQQQQQNDGVAATVTTAKCDGLPIGARRYSRAIRRRMNYALNKYM